MQSKTVRFRTQDGQSFGEVMTIPLAETIFVETLIKRDDSVVLSSIIRGYLLTRDHIGTPTYVERRELRMGND